MHLGDTLASRCLVSIYYYWYLLLLFTQVSCQLCLNSNPPLLVNWIKVYLMRINVNVKSNLTETTLVSELDESVCEVNKCGCKI